MRFTPPLTRLSSAGRRALPALAAVTLLAAGALPAHAGTATRAGVSVVPAAAFATATRVTVSPSGGALVGTPVTLTAALGPKEIIGVGPFPSASAYAGTVQFLIDGLAWGSPVPVTPSATGQPVATASTSTLALGVHAIGAQYVPADASAMTASAATPVSYSVVSRPAFATRTLLVASPATGAKPGAAVDLTATVDPGIVPGPWGWTGDHSGTITFSADGVPLAAPVALGTDGRARLSVSTLALGTHSLTAAFTPVAPAVLGASTSAPLPFTIAVAPSTTTSTKLTVTPGTRARVGENVVLKAVVSPLGPVAGPFAFSGAYAGAVQFAAGGKALGAPVPVTPSGRATLVTSTLPAGTTSLTAQFVPSVPAAIGGSVSPAVAYTVIPDGLATAITLRTSPLGRAKPGKKVTLKATLAVTEPVVGPWVFAGTYTGTVQFRVDGVAIGAPVALTRAGTATLATTTLPTGTMTLTAVFVPADPTALSAATSAPLTFTVAPS